ncbi:MAG: hypothetical protein JO015_08695 [Verrucomicrobia bacterium]|nr:hypothetical protein [Verrucomicrobiota bacterium]
MSKPVPDAERDLTGDVAAPAPAAAPDVSAGADEALYDYEVARDPRMQVAVAAHRAANALAAQRRTVRLLWVSLVLSLAAHVVVPLYLVTVMTRPQKVALLDGTESLMIAPLVPVEESREIIETISYWAAKSLLDRGPQGFDAPETLERVYLPEAAQKARAELKAVAEELAKKNIHQKLEVARIDFQSLSNGVLHSHVVGQLLTEAQVGDEQVNQAQPVTLNLKLIRNPYLGRNKRYPFAVTDYNLGQPESLSASKRNEK